MKKIMLVDDEILIRENIRDSVNWEKEGFIYCGDASDGELALPLIEQWMPDILITDIKMPFMDGLELSAAVRQRMPEIKIIILSGYDDFHYAQAALRLGVEDYCLKPVSSADLIQLLHAAGKRIDEERQMKHRHSYTREKLLADLLGGLIGTAAAIEAAAQLSLPLIARYYAVAVFELHSEPAGTGKEATASREMEKRLVERLEEITDSFSYKRSRTETILLLKGLELEGLHEKLEACCTTIQQELEGLSNVELSIGLGGIHERLQGVRASYLEAEKELMWKRISRQNKSNLWEFTYNPSMETVLIDRNELIEFLKIGTSKEARTFIRQNAAGLESINWETLYGYYLINDLTLELVRAAKQSFQSSQDPEELIKEMQLQIRKIANVQDSQDYLYQLLERLWKWRVEGADKYGELIGKVKRHIRENYENDQLSLQEISRRIGVSPSHLSKVFSQETGQTMTEFLTETRIKKAMELLKTTRSKTFEIAFQVGYNDQHYFSNLFKKIIGMTPREFRRQGSFFDRMDEAGGGKGC
ncbi:response regulator [Paenibacillus albidus]|uniref:response regulator n=1 Tax=Paenibacillus albidus TaxID=2041023 RepID=UPI001BE550F9|nr:response regulator [Paenibacillus albidus]MBT2291881.1 response regulator [Paenibacillus albidus]